jgi:hypothetical protein
MSACFGPKSLCELCQSITFKLWQELTIFEKSTVFECIDEYDEDVDEVDRDNPYNISTLYYIHYPTLETFRKSADDGCQYCYQILYGGFADALEDSEEGWGPVIFLLDNEDSRPRVELRPDEEQWPGELHVKLGMQYRAWMKLREYKGKELTSHEFGISPLILFTQTI